MDDVAYHVRRPKHPQQESSAFIDISLNSDDLLPLPKIRLEKPQHRAGKKRGKPDFNCSAAKSPNSHHSGLLKWNTPQQQQKKSLWHDAMQLEQVRSSSPSGCIAKEQLHSSSVRIHQFHDGPCVPGGKLQKIR